MNRMVRHDMARSTYMVDVHEDPSSAGALRFTFVPTNSRQAPSARAPQPGRQYILLVRGDANEMEFDWIKPPGDDATRKELEAIARQRVTMRQEWLLKVQKLVATVKRWADELGWATRVVDKKMEDAEIGNYTAPALLLQQESIRLFLEPVARSAPGAEGLVDLYLMPSYDDIASLYYYDNRWNVHYRFEDAPVVGNIREAEARPLTKATLRSVVDDMKAHAG